MFKRVFYPFGGALSLECMMVPGNLTKTHFFDKNISY